MSGVTRKKKTLFCERCGGIAKERHTCVTCRRLACEHCVTHHGDRYGGETWWGCYDEGRCVGRNLQPDTYTPKQALPTRAQLESVFGPFTPAQVRRYNKNVKAAALAAKAECKLCDLPNTEHPSPTDGHDVCLELTMETKHDD